jgi:hypothetical protein
LIKLALKTSLRDGGRPSNLESRMSLDILKQTRGRWVLLFFGITASTMIGGIGLESIAGGEILGTFGPCTVVFGSMLLFASGNVSQEIWTSLVAYCVVNAPFYLLLSYTAMTSRVAMIWSAIGFITVWITTGFLVYTLARAE